MKIYETLSQSIGQTPLLKLRSFSEFTGSDIYLKCEHLNPGGSIKDRAALQMVQDAIAENKLKKGMTIIEGTAGNTGIGLALVGKSLGYDVEIVMPNNQSKSKEDLIKAFGAKLHLVDPVPFKDEKHFYHQAKNMAKEKPEEYWWADQFENLSNQKAHYQNTGPEILEQLPDITHFICTAGSGGSISGISKYLKENKSDVRCHLVDPKGSGLKSYIDKGEFVSEGSSFTEGIGIMRLVNNFKEAKLDGAMSLNDQCLVSVAHSLQKLDGIVLGLSSALNAAAAFKLALTSPKGSKIVSLSCDLGERSFAKLYNEDFLKDKKISSGAVNLPELSQLLKSSN